MKSQEVVVKIVGRLDLLYGDSINQQDVRQVIEEVLYDYNVESKGTALAVVDNMDNMILLYLAARKIEGLSKGTLKSYGRVLKRFSNSTGKNVEDITTMDIRIYLINYSKTGVKNSTLATETNILRGFFNWLEDEEYIIKSPMRKIKSPKIEKRLRDALTKEEFEILRTGAKTLRQKALLELLYATGCRLEEVEKMKKSDIDWDNHQIRVIGKGNKERIVYFNTICQGCLKKYFMSRLDDCNTVFVTERKPTKYLGRRAIQREIKKIAKQSELSTNVYPHLIRHTFATHMLNEGMSLSVLQEILGHEEITTTQIYAQMSNENIENEYRKFMISH